MIYRDIEQGSVQWLRLHLGIPTASNFGEFMTTDFECRKGDMPKTFLYKKIAEKMTNAPLPSFNSRATEHGQVFEEEARDFFSLTTGLDVEQVGFITADNGRCGCSPDGLIGEDDGLELKCPNAETHLKYLDGKKVPNDYVQQVHGSLYVTGRKSWHFMSYFPELPPLIVKVERDESIMSKIQACLAKFYADFDATLNRLTH